MHDQDSNRSMVVVMTQAYHRPETVSYYKRLNICFTWPVDILSYQLINKDMLNVMMSQLQTLTFMQKNLLSGATVSAPTSYIHQNLWSVTTTNIQHHQLQSATDMRSSVPTSPVAERHRYEIKCSNITSCRAPQIWDQVFQHHQLQSATDMRATEVAFHPIFVCKESLIYSIICDYWTLGYTYCSNSTPFRRPIALGNIPIHHKWKSLLT